MDIDDEYIKCAGANSIFARQDINTVQNTAFQTTDADELMIDDSEEP